MERFQLFLAVGALALAGLAGAWFAGRPPSPVPVEVERGAGAAEGDSSITVHVSGAVASPGLVLLPEGARVGDAVAAAGGARPAADIGAVNLAAPVHDGEQVVIPERSAGATPSPIPADDGAVRVNHATEAELETLPGVGPVLAARIVAYREEHGPLETVEDLLEVPGIGEATLAELRDLVIVP